MLRNLAWVVVLALWAYAAIGFAAGGAVAEPIPEESASPSPSPIPSTSGSPSAPVPPEPVEIVKWGPTPFTPNGDGHHDTVRMVFRLNGSGEMVATVHRQSGKTVRVLARAPLGPGRYLVKWDGRGRRLQPVKAAFYLLRIRLKQADGTISFDAEEIWLKR
jgi:hypothetical protein